MRRHRLHVWAAAIALLATALLAVGGDLAPGRATTPVPGTAVGLASGRSLERQRLVVQVVAYGCSGLSQGSGVLAPGGRVLTNRHVVAGAAYAEVRTATGLRIGARIDAVGADLDLAVLWIGDGAGTSSAPAGHLDTGERLALAGYPYGRPYTVSVGPVTARHRFDQEGMRADGAFVDADVDVGSSGGAAFDGQNHVAGIVFAREQRTGLAAVIDGDTVTRFLAGDEPQGDPAACEDS
jgi:S1-C subfamily serine protease